MKISSISFQSGYRVKNTPLPPVFTGSKFDTAEVYESLDWGKTANMQPEEVFAYINASVLAAKAKKAPKELYSTYGAEKRLFVFEGGVEPYFGKDLVEFDLDFLDRKPLEMGEIGTYDFPKEAREQSIALAKGKMPLDVKLLDGFRYHGDDSVFDEKGNNTARPKGMREMIIVNAHEDKILAKAVESFKKGISGKGFSEKETVVQMFYFIDKVFDKTPRGEEDTHVFGLKMRHSPPKEALLGDIMNDGEGVCRHRAMLAKVLADAVDIKMNVMSNKRHAWNEALLDGERFWFDPMLEALFNLDRPSEDAKQYLEDYRPNLFA